MLWEAYTPFPMRETVRTWVENWVDSHPDWTRVDFVDVALEGPTREELDLKLKDRTPAPESVSALADNGSPEPTTPTRGPRVINLITPSG